MDPQAEYLGVTDSTAAVRELADQTPDGMTLKIDMNMARKQAQMICGEDKPLALTFVLTILALTEVQTDLRFDADSGEVYEDLKTDSSEEGTYLRGCVVGKAGGYLTLLSMWPDDPLKMAGLPLRDVEHRASVLWADAANRLGMIPTIL